MSKVNELSPRDKKLLDSFDISMFKSAVAYIQNHRYNSSQPTWNSEGKSPPQQKKIKDKEPPLLPMESRIAILSKKYGSDSFAVKTKKSNENRAKIVEIFHYKAKSIESNTQEPSLDENAIIKKKVRRSSHVFQR
jgi:hypothetical protein